MFTTLLSVTVQGEDWGWCPSLAHRLQRCRPCPLPENPSFGLICSQHQQNRPDLFFRTMGGDKLRLTTNDIEPLNAGIPALLVSVDLHATR